jgi:hypothetical protein
MSGRAKTSAHLVAAPFRSVSPCAGFEPCPSILAMINRIFIVALDVARTEGWIFLRCGRTSMAQTRRMGMQNQKSITTKAPRFSPYRLGIAHRADLDGCYLPQRQSIASGDSLQSVDYLMMAAMFSRLSLRAVREKEIEGRGGVVLAATCSEYKGEGDRGISQG